MDTSGDGVANVILYLVVLVLSLQVAVRLLRASALRRRFPIIAAIFTTLIGVPSLLQFVWPQITSALERIPTLTLQDGQWWRVLTAIGAQDGGLIGAVFNLLVVAVVVTLGEWIWGSWRTVVLFIGPSIILNLLAIAWAQTGGGSSFASDGLLMSLCGLGLVTLRSAVVRVCAGAAILSGIALVVLNDAHGVAVLLGAVLGIIFGGLMPDALTREGARGPLTGRPST